MRAMSRVVLLATLIATIGCLPGPSTIVPVLVRATGPTAAELRVTVLQGLEPPNIDHCPTPCLVTVPPDAVYRLSVSAPGYCPASVTLSGATLWKWKPIGTTLENPLLPRR